jgi:hypothetical protein
MQLHQERIATSTPECQAGVLVVRRHHLLVRTNALVFTDSIPLDELPEVALTVVRQEERQPLHVAD